MKKHDHCQDCGFSGEGLMSIDVNTSTCFVCSERRLKKVKSPEYNILSSFEDQDKDYVKSFYSEALKYQRSESYKSFQSKLHSLEHEHSFNNETVSVEKKERKKNKNILQPREVQQFLQQRIIGQDEAVRDISIAISQHTKRMSLPKVEKNNILLLGPSGTGKTHMFRAISDLLGVPFVIANATEYTGSGFVGQDVSDILVNLYFAANEDPYRLERGIVLVDEADKLAEKDGENVNTKRVQDEFLKMIEGTVMNVNVGSKSNPHNIDIDTKNILFVFAGAFEGLKDIVEAKQKQHSKTIAICKEEQESEESVEWQSLIETEHLQCYGMTRELLGRLPVITYTKDLTEDELKRVLTEPKGSLISQEQELLSVDEITVKFTEEFLSVVAKESLQKKTGARGLRSILSKKLKDLHFNAGDKYFGRSIVVDVDGIKLKPQKNLQNNKQEVWR